ncbi:MAG TPA: hypothetical protein VGD77_06950 [Gemmatimonadaceae bacterium]
MSPHKRRPQRWAEDALTALVLITAAPALLRAQEDRTPEPLRVAVAVGPSWASSDTWRRGVGYVVQGSLTKAIRGTRFAARGDVGYSHPADASAPEGWDAATASVAHMRGSSTVWAAASLVGDGPRLLGGRSYGLAGLGVAQEGWMSARSGTAAAGGRGGTGLILQSGAGISWRAGTRAAFVEARAQGLIRSAERRSMLIPLVVGVTF